MDVAEILLRRGLIDQSQLNAARNSGDLLSWAEQQNGIDNEAVMRAVAEEMGLDYIDLREFPVDLTLLETFPQKLIYRETLFPIQRKNGSIRVATADPFNFLPPG